LEEIHLSCHTFFQTFFRNIFFNDGTSEIVIFSYENRSVTALPTLHQNQTAICYSLQAWMCRHDIIVGTQRRSSLHRGCGHKRQWLQQTLQDVAR